MFSYKTRTLANVRLFIRETKQFLYGLPIMGKIVLLALLAVVVVGFGLFHLLRATFRLVAGSGQKLHAIYRAFLHRHVDNIGLVGGLLVVVGVSYGMFLIDPRTPTLSLATLQVIVAAPALLFVILNCTIWTYKHLLPDQFRQFVGQLGAKIDAVALPPIEELLGNRRTTQESLSYASCDEVLSIARFKLIYHITNFLIKCVRYVLYSLPFYFIAKLLLALLVLVLNLQPH